MLAVFLASGLAPGANAANERCAALTITLSLTGQGGVFEDFFVATENASGSFYVWLDGDSCAEDTTTRVWYSARGVTTDPGDLTLDPGGPVDLYTPSSGREPHFQQVDVEVTGPISGVEKATLQIDKAENSDQEMANYNRRTVPLYVLDTNGPSGFALGETALRASEGLTAVLPIFRTGPVTGSDSVQFEIEPLTAEAGADYTVPSSNSVSFSGTSRRGIVSIPLKSDGQEEGDETFKVTLLGSASPSETTVTIIDTTLSDLRPKGRLHHPKLNYRYPQNYPWLNEIHIFTSAADEVRAPVNRAQLAIRKRLKSGSCAWWGSGGFSRGGCSQTRWFGKNIKKPAENYFKYKLSQRLPLSIGSGAKVADYKIWGRWFDREGRQSILRKGRNLNQFEVIKPTQACRKNPFNFRKCKPVGP